MKITCFCIHHSQKASYCRFFNISDKEFEQRNISINCCTTNGVRIPSIEIQQSHPKSTASSRSPLSPTSRAFDEKERSKGRGRQIITYEERNWFAEMGMRRCRIARRCAAAAHTVSSTTNLIPSTPASHNHATPTQSRLLARSRPARPSRIVARHAAPARRPPPPLPHNRPPSTRPGAAALRARISTAAA
jgi:hypothetical protein